ncbi:MAG: hypothetical protein IJZ58_03245 [Oscillospiraceae bacterium]|nr:hypothetical protein [Oscillospiraceae bacterium]
MKRIIALLLAIVLTFSVSVTAFAEEFDLKVAEVTGEKGNTVEVPFNLVNNPGYAGMDLKIEYDNTVLELVEITLNKFPSSSMASVASGKISGGDSKDIIGDGVAFIAKFVIKDTAKFGKSEVSVTIYECFNIADDNVPFTVVPGSVTVVCANHSFVKEVATKDYLATEATCTEPATYYYSCECGVKGTETFKSGDPIPHTYNVENAEDGYLATEATCTEPATYYYSCECGASSKDTSDEKVFAAGETVPHTFDKEEASEKYFVSGATCTEKAKYYKSCSVCGEKGTEIFEYGETLPHDFVKVADDKYLATEATCTEVATYYMSCSVCGEADSETFEHGEVLPHDFTAEVAESKYVVGEATCGEPATYYRSCSVCGESSNDENNTFANGEPLGHTWGATEYSWAADNSSCTATRVCTIETCGKEEVNTTNNVKVETTDATCSAEGKTVYTAEFVNDWAETQTKTVAIAINPEAHAWNKGEVTTEPTCSAMGVKTYTCQHNAEHTKTEDIAINPDAHAWSVSYNWTDDGLACTATRACANNAEHNVVAEAEVTGVKTKEPTCSAMGDTQYTAKFAADWAETQVTTRTDVAINPDAHDWDAWKVTEYPTYGVAGKETRVCVINPEHKEYHELDALEMPKQEEADKVVIDEKEYFVGEEVIAPEETKDVPKEIVDETKLNKKKYNVSFVGVIIGAFDDAGEFTKEDVKGTVTIGFPEGADKNDKFEVYVIDAQGNVTKLAGADVTEAGIEVEVDGSATFAIAYESVSNHSGRPVRPSTGSGSGSADKDAEENPNTGAPFMGYVPVMVVAAAVAICKKRH